jgi:hypothetical protein
MNSIFKFFTVSTFAFCILSSSFISSKETDFTFPSKKILINNRIIIKILNKPISVLDISKNLDLIFAKQYPDLKTSTEAKFQFYENTWLQALQEMINKEIVLEDAKEIGMTISDAEIRQQLEESFGPDVHEKLESLGITTDIAWKDTHDEMLLQRMMIFRVRLKAKSKISPQQVKNAYLQFTEAQGPSQEWKYRVISLRGDDDKIITDNTNQLSVNLQGKSWEEAQQILEEFQKEHKEATLSISKPYQHGEKQMSPAYHQALSSLEPGFFSSPQIQLSRSNGKPVYRIFFLETLLSNPAPSFDDTQKSLENLVSQEAFNNEFNSYLNLLREKYGVTEQLTSELIPLNYKPFVLR